MKLKDTAKFIDIDGLTSHLQAMSAEEGKDFLAFVEKAIKAGRTVHENAPLDGEDYIIYHCADGMYRAWQYSNYTPEQNLEGSWVNVQKRALAKVRRFAMYADEGAPIYVGRWAEGEFAFLYMGNPDKGIVIPEPEKYMTVVPGRDYSNITPAAMRQALPGEDNVILPVLKGQPETFTHQELEGTKESLSEQMEDLRSKMDNVKEAKTGELAEIQAKIDAMMAELESKKEAMMAQLSQKKAEMEAQMEKLNNQIYLLDSQIYSILCYNGETVNFTRILSGKKAADTEPVIIFQKLRFLDEELGKLASLYTIDWEDLDMFEDLLRYNPTARETFAPYERCVQLVRLSRTGKLIGKYHDEDGLPNNILVDYEYYHGKTVGIIIRNGENLYLGWTDESRVHIQDDLVVDFSRTVVMPEPEKKHDPYMSRFTQEAEEQKRKQEAKEFIDGYISRQFVFNILQGVVDHSNILPLPQGVTLGKQSEYVVYSMADGALEDNRFGSFNEIIKKCNASLKVGDILLTTQHLSPEYYTHNDRYRAWNNPRGRGSANRTHDADVDDCALYPVNVIDVDIPSKKLTWRLKGKGEDTRYSVSLDSIIAESDRDISYLKRAGMSKYKDMTDEQIRALSMEVKDTDGTVIHVMPPEEDCEDLTVVQPDPIRHIFVSAEKSGEYYWRETEKKARANFELYSDEYIDLAFMNSVWLEYFISSQKLGNWSVGGKCVDYAYGIRYLKTALDHIREREKTEKALIDAIDPEVCKDHNWPLKLTEWKMEKDIHTITEYQAKRFVKAVREGASHK